MIIVLLLFWFCVTVLLVLSDAEIEKAVPMCCSARKEKLFPDPWSTWHHGGNVTLWYTGNLHLSLHVHVRQS